MVAGNLDCGKGVGVIPIAPWSPLGPNASRVSEGRACCVQQKMMLDACILPKRRNLFAFALAILNPPWRARGNNLGRGEWSAELLDKAWEEEVDKWIH